MDLLHGSLCSYFLKLLDGKIPELAEASVSKVDEETGETITYKAWKETGFMVRPSAGEIAVMAKFLKDNAITGAIGEGSDLDALNKKLAERHQRRGKLPTPADVKQAMAELGGSLLN